MEEEASNTDVDEQELAWERAESVMVAPVVAQALGPELIVGLLVVTILVLAGLFFAYRRMQQDKQIEEEERPELEEGEKPTEDLLEEREELDEPVDDYEEMSLAEVKKAKMARVSKKGEKRATAGEATEEARQEHEEVEVGDDEEAPLSEFEKAEDEPAEDEGEAEEASDDETSAKVEKVEPVEEVEEPAEDEGDEEAEDAEDEGADEEEFEDADDERADEEEFEDAEDERADEAETEDQDEEETDEEPAEAEEEAEEETDEEEKDDEDESKLAAPSSISELQPDVDEDEDEERREAEEASDEEDDETGGPGLGGSIPSPTDLSGDEEEEEPESETEAADEDEDEGEPERAAAEDGGEVEAAAEEAAVEETDDVEQQDEEVEEETTEDQAQVADEGAEDEAEVVEEPDDQQADEQAVEAAEEQEEKADEDDQYDPEAEPKSFEKGLEKTREGLFDQLSGFFTGEKLDPEMVEEVEEVLFQADIGPRVAQDIIDAIEEHLSGEELADPGKVWGFIRHYTEELLSTHEEALETSADKPYVVLVVGVNGVGKTTTIGKMASRFKREGKSSLLVAGDTFRAGAVDQLGIWAERTGLPMHSGEEGADPASVIYEGVEKAEEEDHDIVLCDTSGRLHTDKNLMEELKKMERVAGKAKDGAPHEVHLVLDANTGQNAIAQAEKFDEALDVTGMTLTKFDGTARGGVILGVCKRFDAPVRYVGIGERVVDLREFHADEFTEALFM